MEQLEPKIKAFCYKCKAPQPLDWTTGNKSLDSFIMESWSNVKKEYDVESWSNVENEYDAYIQWIEYSLLMNVREMSSLCNGCTHTTDWLDPKTNEPTRVTLKKIVDGQDAQLFDFHQVN